MTCFDPRPVCVVFVADGVALAQLFLRLLKLSPVSIIPVIRLTQPFVRHRRYVNSAAEGVVRHTEKREGRILLPLKTRVSVDCPPSGCEGYWNGDSCGWDVTVL